MGKQKISAIAYLRVSTKEQADKDLSIPAQRKAIQAWAKANGRMVIEWIADEGASAYADPLKRKGFVSMLSKVRDGEASEVLVHKSDRFSRDMETSVVTKAFLRKVGVKVVSTTEPIDTDSPSGRLMEGMLDLMAQFTSDNISMEVKKGMREMIEQGSYPGSHPPYGYDRIKRADGRFQLRPNPKESRIVKQIFGWAEAGDGPTKITERLNKRKVPSQRTDRWGRASVRRILRNQSYCGDTIWGKGDDRRTYPDTHKGIVTREQFEAVQRLRKQRAKSPPGRPAREALLSGLVYGYCGHKYYTQRHSNARKGYYLCGEKMNRGFDTCVSPNVPIVTSDEAVLNALLDYAITPEQIAEIRDASAEGLATRDDSGELAKAETRLEEIAADRERIAAAIVKGVSLDTLAPMEAKLVEERDKLLDTMRVIRSTTTTADEAARQWDSLEVFAASLRKNWARMPIDLKKRAVAEFVDRVVVEADKTLTVYFRYPGGGTLPPVSTGGKRKKPGKSTTIKSDTQAWLRNAFHGDKSEMKARYDLGVWLYRTGCVRKLPRAKR